MQHTLLYIAIYCLLGSLFYIMGYQSGVAKASQQYNRLMDRVTERHKVDKNNDR